MQTRYRQPVGPTSTSRFRARCIWTIVTAELQAKLTCIQNNNATCIPPGVSTELEILPFYEMQTTWLSFWRDNVSGRPVEVSNDTIADDNSHSRGMAELTDTDVQTVSADTYIHPGNNGLTSTDPIDPGYDAALVVPRPVYRLPTVVAVAVQPPTRTVHPAACRVAGASR